MPPMVRISASRISRSNPFHLVPTDDKALLSLSKSPWISPIIGVQICACCHPRPSRASQCIPCSTTSDRIRGIIDLPVPCTSSITTTTPDTSATPPNPPPPPPPPDTAFTTSPTAALDAAAAHKALIESAFPPSVAVEAPVAPAVVIPPSLDTPVAAAAATAVPATSKKDPKMTATESNTTASPLQWCSK
ncbi:hypothetical protein B0H13DRAFT_2366914 [Mycena leptocephala]|nr:hypothetical protein B0H13DRAFT_2366914 [Mycena leptocephala]